MIITVKIILFYLIGCILSYGRIYASFYEIDEEFIDDIPPNSTDSKFMLVSLLSWITFLVGTIIYFFMNEKYFLKYSSKDLWKRYNNRK